MGGKVIVANPALENPFMDASEISLSGEDHGRFSLTTGLAYHGESVRRIRGAGGNVDEVWFGGNRLLSEARAAAELEERYGR
jgi:D-alanyl-D-alanine carboxypeptidase